MKTKFRRTPVATSVAMAMTIFGMAGCGAGSSDSGEAPLPQLAAATAATRQDCAGLLSSFSFASTNIVSATVVPAGSVTILGQAAPLTVPDHCQVTGTMNSRVGTNGNYAIGFEMRLPTNWNGRFFYQANGGTDGAVAPALGPQSGGGGLSDALRMGFAVISSDAGHNNAQNAPGATNFGLDPQARLDYGYQAIGTLTPMARSLVQKAYGKVPDRMYIGGCSNGGRQTLVAASRYADQYDGFLAGDPGFNLPKAGVQEMWDTQQLAKVGTATLPNGLPNISTAFTPAELNLLSSKIVAKCDALDGATDNMVQDVAACQATFKLDTDVATCSGARDGTCLTPSQKSVISAIFGGVKNSAGAPLYSTFPLDRGLAGSGWAFWKYVLNTSLGAGAMPYIFVTPPVAVPGQDLLNYVLNFNMDTDAPKIFATSGAFTRSSMDFMTPPNPTDLSTAKNRGAKVIVYHGTGDPVFSSDDTARWYNGLASANGGTASNFARYFPVPAMNHCAGGPATDQFDAITAMVNWVERGQVPDSIVASARGAGNAGGVNPEIPANWSASRTRPLCPYPQIARLKAGATDLESASSFQCQ